jgi:DNA-directed RNA polymerase III subunit RPC3
MQDIKKHLQLLAESTPPLLIQTGTRGLGEYAVPFDPLIRHVRLVELESLILSRFGPCALRITRILAEKGSKLDEKTISNLALVKQKEIRVTLTAMHEGGFLDLQEVPRDNSRAPSRTIYLWYYDPDRVRLRVLEDVYKCMARTLQRSRSEREALQGLLAKAERSDVKGNEETFLTNSERLALRTWGEKEERLLVQLGRLERLVGVFRDF